MAKKAGFGFSILRFCSVFFLSFFLINSLAVFLEYRQFNIGLPTPRFIEPHQKVHDMIGKTMWSNLRPCGSLFDEQAEFKKARSCVNTKVWPTSPIPETVTIPRCYIVSIESPDVYSRNGFNFIPLNTVLGVAAVVGFYDTATKTIFVVENVDAAIIARHELQHFFLHVHDPESGGEGHTGDLWTMCEPPTYNPSLKSKKVAELLE